MKLRIALISAHLLALVQAKASVTSTTNYIDTIKGYHALATCAQDVLSTVVRAQMSGCGDNEQLTSYTCFCTDSSSFFNNLIAQDVATSCVKQPAQVTSAVKIFSGYCALGVEAGLPKATNALTTQGSPTGPTVVITGLSSPPVPTQTKPPTSQGDVDASEDKKRTTAIAAGVGVPLIILSIVAVAFYLYRRRQQQKREYPPQELPDHGFLSFQQPPPRPAPPPQALGLARYDSRSMHQSPGGLSELSGYSSVYSDKPMDPFYAEKPSPLRPAQAYHPHELPTPQAQEAPRYELDSNQPGATELETRGYTMI